MINSTHQKLTKSTTFLNWQKDHQTTYLTHFYCQIDKDFKPTSPWEIGFYSKDHDKITTFIIDQEITIKPEEEAFKKQGIVEELDLKKVTLDFPQALETFKKVQEEKYSPQIMMGGFLILQKFQKKTMWNISFSTKSMNILNIKINTENQEVISDELINFIERKAG